MFNIYDENKGLEYTGSIVMEYLEAHIKISNKIITYS